MNKLDRINIIQQNIEVLYTIQIRRNKIDNNALNVIPLALGQNLILLQDLYDFEPDGFRIIRIKDITTVRLSNSEKFSQYILQAEGILNQIRKPPINTLDNWENVLNELSNIGKNVIVECETKEDGEFYIGKIVNIGKKSLLFLHFNGIGEWDREPTEIFLKNITSIRYDARYINIMSKYLKL